MHKTQTMGIFGVAVMALVAATSFAQMPSGGSGGGQGRRNGPQGEVGGQQGSGLDSLRTEMGATPEEWKVIAPLVQKVMTAQNAVAEGPQLTMGGMGRGGPGGGPGGMNGRDSFSGPGAFGNGGPGGGGGRGGWGGGPPNDGNGDAPARMADRSENNAGGNDGPPPAGMDGGAPGRPEDGQNGRGNRNATTRPADGEENGPQGDRGRFGGGGGGRGFQGGPGGGFGGGGGGGGGPPGGGMMGGQSPVTVAMSDLEKALKDSKSTDAEIAEKVTAVRAARAKAKADLAVAKEKLMKVVTPDEETALIAAGVID